MNIIKTISTLILLTAFASGAAIAEGKKLWQAYFEQTDARTIRDELKLNRADVGWYQIRKALEIIFYFTVNYRIGNCCNHG